jgi:hypothetical protein
MVTTFRLALGARSSPGYRLRALDVPVIGRLAVYPADTKVPLPPGFDLRTHLAAEDGAAGEHPAVVEHRRLAEAAIDIVQL